MMKDMVLRWVLRQLLTYLTRDKLEEWAEAIKNWIGPNLRAWKEDLMVLIRGETSKTDNTWDDDLADAFDTFLEAFLPDSKTTLDDARKKGKALKAKKA